VSWRLSADDPNAPEALEPRDAVLRRATRAPVDNRAQRIAELCQGRRVVDIGCVDHCVATHERSTWLHRRIVETASFCLGVDIAEEGVAAMNAAGYHAVVHDVSTGLGPVADFAPFDVVVAGEVIEHLGAPQGLFDFASAALVPDGVLVITTPNPYAPHRVRAGQRGVTWENADHLVYAFPSGIVELGARSGFELEEYRTLMVRPFRRELKLSVIRWARSARQRLAGRGRGVATDPLAPMREAQELYVNPIELALVAATRSRTFLGGTALYVLRKASAPTSSTTDGTE
jgi:SAM-dependent methyltransferase